MQTISGPGRQHNLSVRVALAQINSTVGDLEGNTARIISSIHEASHKGADIVVFPELAICGYPPEDLLLRPRFVSQNLACLEQVAEETHGPVVVVGFVDSDSDVYNAAAVIHDGRIAHVYHKVFLPNYGVFDENRYFREGRECPVFRIGGVGVGVTICEDVWYEGGPASVQAAHGAELILNLSASPYHRGKGDSRRQMFATRARDNVCVFAMCNLVGGQDELVFDGDSMVIDEQGRVLAAGRPFEEDVIYADVHVESVFRARLHDPRWRKTESLLAGQCLESSIDISGATAVGERPPIESSCPPALDTVEEVYKALVLGTADYVRKNGFEKVVIGLSGGIDSSMVACIACDALGPENVIGVRMPSRYTSELSDEDASGIAANLGFRTMEIPIEPAYQSFVAMLAESFAQVQPDSTEENLQARIRGTILMSLSNKFGWLVLTTGNKSEMATGYTTLYGDMAGGFAVLKDVPKTLVYQLAAYRNALNGENGPIPRSTIERPPSAELRPDQKDSDSLPRYDVLDHVLKAYVEDDRSIAQIVAQGYDAAVVERTVRLVDGSEYKRRQSPPGIKITTRAFGRDRRLPITNRFHG